MTGLQSWDNHLVKNLLGAKTDAPIPREQKRAAGKLRKMQSTLTNGPKTEKLHKTDYLSNQEVFYFTY